MSPSPKKTKTPWTPDPSAYCPVNLANGDSYIFFVPGQRVIEIHLRENGLIDQVVHFPNGAIHHSKSFFGFVDLEHSGIAYVPESPLQELLPLRAGDTKQLILRTADDPTTRHSHRWEITKATKTVIGRCRYDTLEIHCYAGHASSPYGLSHTHTIDYSLDLQFPLTRRMGRHGNLLADREIRPIQDLETLLSCFKVEDK